MALLEARPYRPFKSSEEYLEAMKEDLAEWLNMMYPELQINAETFMDKLDTGVTLCKHANYVRQAAEIYLAKRQARSKSMSRSMTSGLAGPILAMGNVHYLPAAKSGTFFARDNVSNFITWCRKSLKIIECLLFETDDLIMRKNEKHVILCLLEVARRGAKFGMLAPMLVQMERQIDREIAADNKANGFDCSTSNNGSGDCCNGNVISVDSTQSIGADVDLFDSDSENGDEDENGPMLMYGPQPQIITNDLKSLDEMVRDLVEQCTCPSQFPMVRVSEGKYRIGDTKVLIFVRILRSHVMVRVGGGWDTLSHYLDKHDPCRCRAQHRSSIAARLIPRTNNQSNGIELHKAQVIFERSPPAIRKTTSVIQSEAAPSLPANASYLSLSPMSHMGLKIRSRSPTSQLKFRTQFNSENPGSEKLSAGFLPSPNLVRRSMSPNPRRLVDMRKKQASLDSSCDNSSKSLPLVSELNVVSGNHVQFNSLNAIVSNDVPVAGTASQGLEACTNSNKFENTSDNGSEISDEGYRSLGVIQSNSQKRETLQGQTSIEDAENNARLDQTCSDLQLSPVDDFAVDKKPYTISEIVYSTSFRDSKIDGGPQSLPSVLPTATVTTAPSSADNKFEECGIFITDDSITINTTQSTGPDTTHSAAKVVSVSDASRQRKQVSKIPRSPNATRRGIRESSVCGGSLQELNNQISPPAFNRKQPVFRSMRKFHSNTNTMRKISTPSGHGTWNGRSITNNSSKKRPSVNADTFASTTAAASELSTFERGSKLRSSQVLPDTSGCRTKDLRTPLGSPIKSYASSPLAQQLLEAASSAKNDAQILEKMKTLLSLYAPLKCNTVASAPHPTKLGAKKFSAEEDFTTAWVHSNGNLERSNSCSPPIRSKAKRGSTASSIEGSQREMSMIVSPRPERGSSRIPGPIRQHTELY